MLIGCGRRQLGWHEAEAEKTRDEPELVFKRERA
jgi:hypothetical protein